jgi:3-isopropylmalate/(R)-2-methylmalate dehydratase small subunit
MRIKGKIFIFGDNVNTDEIIPARYLTTSDTRMLVRYCLEDIRPGFGRRKDIKSSIIVAGQNFGCGSSREHAALTIKGSGIACVVARSFARIFLRNAINIGLPIVELKDVSDFKENHLVEVDLQKGEIINQSLKSTFSFTPYPEFMQGIIRSGGWMNFAKEQKGQDIEP